MHRHAWDSLKHPAGDVQVFYSVAHTDVVTLSDGQAEEVQQFL